jgi:hypothetical protein
VKHQSLEWESGCRGSGSNKRPPVRELAHWTTRPHRRPGNNSYLFNNWLHSWLPWIKTALFGNEACCQTFPEFKNKNL